MSGLGPTPPRQYSSSKLLLVLLGFLIALILLELAIRCFVGVSRGQGIATTPPVQSGRWVSHPFLPYAGRPIASYRFRNSRPPYVEDVTTNSYGFRAHEFPLEKHEDDYFVVCLGGSTTFGYAASNELTWPELLERKLADQYPNRNVRVFNLGQDMATSTISLVNLLIAGIHINPDLVIVYHGFNDLAALGATDYRTDHSHFYVDLDPEKVWRGVELALPAWARRSYAITWLAGGYDLLFRLNDLASLVKRPHQRDQDSEKGMPQMLQNLATMEATARGHGAKVLFSTFQFRDGNEYDYRRFNNRLREYLEAEGFAYIDQDELIADYDPLINVDECHFTQAGRDLMAQNYSDYIVKNGLVD